MHVFGYFRCLELIPHLFFVLLDDGLNALVHIVVRDFYSLRLAEFLQSDGALDSGYRFLAQLLAQFILRTAYRAHIVVKADIDAGQGLRLLVQHIVDFIVDNHRRDNSSRALKQAVDGILP